MRRSALIIFLVNYCAFLFSQTPTYSRKFEAYKKNVPLAIINTHVNYFHLLRYNKEAHDFTLERRDKLTAEMIKFNPLKLDLINANWFNYENLDYILFENNHKVCFVFEKLTNFKREIFLKIIDTLGIATDFISLAVLDKEKSIEDFNFKLTITKDKKILIIGAQTNITGLTKKTVVLYDPEKQEKVWVKKLPPENYETGFSKGFECNEKGDLFYALLKPRVVSYKRKYLDRRQQLVPVFAYEIKGLAAYLNGEKQPVRVQLSITDPYQVYSVTLLADNSNVTAVLHYTKMLESGEESIFFLTEKWNADLTHPYYKREISLDNAINKQLTYYDGTDFKSASDKEFSTVDHFYKDSTAYVLSEHKDENSYKELLLLKIDLQSGKILQQQLIPRKLLFYKGRSHYKNLSESIRTLCDGSYHNIVLESARNAIKTPQDYKYKKFAKASGLKGGNIVSYALKPDGNSAKKILFSNDDYEYIPLPTQLNGCELLMYLTNGAFEKFVTLRLNP